MSRNTSEANVDTGDGKCNLPEAMRSPGDSNVTTGTPNVTPSNEPNAPPSEWPMIHMSERGYIYDKLLYRFCIIFMLDLSSNQRRVNISYRPNLIEEALRN